MHDHSAYWKGEINRQPAVLAVLVVMAIVWMMNANAGYQLGSRSVMLGAVFVMIGVIAAVCGAIYGQASGFRRQCLLIAAIAGFLIDQFSGWQNLGLTLADGQVSRATLADGLAGKAKLKASKQAELDQINAGKLRARASIEADIKLECDRKGKMYPDGVGPKCTALRGELGTIDRKAVLEKEIVDLQRELATGPQVASGAPQYAVPIAIADGLGWVLHKTVGLEHGKVGPEQVTFFTEVMLAAAMGLVATFGLPLLGVGHGGGDDAMAPDFQRLLPRTGGTGNGGGGGGGPVGGLPLSAAGPLAPAGGSPAAHGPAGHGGQAYGSPIHINVGMAGAPGVTAPVALVQANPVADARAVDRALGLAPQRRDLAALPGDGRPIDRAGVALALDPAEREAADVMLGFRRAVIEDAPGGHVAMVDLYKRYCRWAGERAVSASTFGALFPGVTGVTVAEIGGALHATGIALKAAVALRPVGREAIHAA
jgi:hypothetical protein